MKWTIEDDKAISDFTVSPAKLSRLLNRSVGAIRQRRRRLGLTGGDEDGDGRGRRWNEMEVRNLRHYHAQGLTWAKIGEAMDLPAEKCFAAWRYYTNKADKGAA